MPLRFSVPKLPKRLKRTVAEAEAEPRHRIAKAAPAALLLATGAGAAVWWWTQWARGRAESEAAEATPAADPWTSAEG